MAEYGVGGRGRWADCSQFDRSRLRKNRWLVQALLYRGAGRGATELCNRRNSFDDKTRSRVMNARYSGKTKDSRIQASPRGCRRTCHSERAGRAQRGRRPRNLPATDDLSAADVELFSDQCRSPKQLIPLVRDADAVITPFAPVDGNVVATMNKARVIVRYGIGVDNVDLNAARDKGIPVCNIPEYCIDEDPQSIRGLAADIVARRGA
jgi:hypothetical protein